MKQWLNYFKIWFLVCGIIIIVCGVISFKPKNETHTPRANSVCTETERVFDYADVLTDSEENSLRELIAKAEVNTECDIVLVTLNQSLEEYAKSYFPNASGSDFAMITADNFYDEYGFGWIKSQESDDGDGVLLLDNYYREADGKIYTWLSTSGKAETKYSSAMIDQLLDNVYVYINDDPYEAYKAYIETFEADMTGKHAHSVIPVWFVFAAPALAAVIFISANMSGKEGARTTTSSTYVEGGAGNFSVMQDNFLRKTVTQRKIESSSSGGGGGHHTSSGGHSHGGGGHSR